MNTFVVSAGPGTGKTYTLSNMLIARRETSEKPFIVTSFTRVGAREIRDRAIRLGLRLHPDDFFGTMHSLAYKLCTENAHHLEISKRPLIMRPDMANTLLVECAKDAQCKASLKTLREHLPDGIARIGSVPSTRGIRAAISNYISTCVRHGLIEYEMMMQWGRLAALRSMATTGAIFVDEAQDTSPGEHSLLDAIDKDVTVMVGDFAQSIYEWRGAYPQIFGNLAKSDDTKMETLTKSFRFGPEIAACCTNLRQTMEMPESLRHPIKGSQDQPGMACATGYANQEAQDAAIVKHCKKNIGKASIAVITRTNREVDHFTELLRVAGLSLNTPPREDITSRMAWLCVAAVLIPGQPAILKELASAFDLKADMALLWDELNLDDLDLGGADAFPDWAEQTLGDSAGATMRSLWDETMPRTLNDVAFALCSPEIKEVPPDYAKQTVHVSTIHGAKGGEWDHVLLPNWHEGGFPTGGKRENLQEQIRCAYVAISRARSYVCASWCDFGLRNPFAKEAEELVRSRFVDYAKFELCEPAAV
jgi:superfamily I DNA/RNA helicase